MPTPSEKQAMYLAESTANETAISAYLTKYPERAVGETIEDYDGFDWEIVFIGATKGSVWVLGKYIDEEEGATEYVKTLNNILLQKALYTFADSFLITDAGGGVAQTTYTLTDAIGGEMVQITIEGGAALNPATDYTWDSETGELVFSIPVMIDQQVDYLYKKNPYS